MGDNDNDGLCFGVIGAGMIARVHAQAIIQMDGGTLAGIMDNGRGSAADIAPDCDLTGSGDLDQFLARNDIDVVTIATPSGTHAEIAVKAAQAGKHVICEKPLDITLPSIDRMIDVCNSARVKLGGIFNTRYTEGAQLIKRAVDDGRFGKLTFGQALGPWWRDPAYYSESTWKGTFALDGGGALMNQGIHSIDLLQWLMGSAVTRVAGFVSTLAHPTIEVEDTGVASLEFANGALGNLACTTSLWPGHYRTITIGGTHGTAVLADGNLMLWQFRDEQPDDAAIRQRLGGLPGQGVGASDPSAGVDADGHEASLRDFVEALKHDRQPDVDGIEARKAVQIILAVYESSIGGGKPISLAYRQ